MSDFTEEEMRDLKDQFNKIDIDKSGHIDIKELSMLLKAIGEASIDDSKLKAIISEVDTDKSGELDFKEFLDVVKSYRSGKGNSAMSKIYGKERDAAALQKKTFTIWCNTHLQSKDKDAEIKDLFNDLKDGILLCKLIEALSEKKLKYNATPKMGVHMQENIGIALKQLQADGIKLVNIGPSDVHSGTPTTILGLIWTIILFYQMQGLGGEGVGAKAALLQWVHKQLEPYPDVQLPQNFGPDFRDGKSMATLVHRLTGGPGAGPYDQKSVMSNEPLKNHDIAFDTALKRLEVPRLLDPQDMIIPKPDENSVMTYVAYLKNAHDKLRAKRALKPEAYAIVGPKTAEAGVMTTFKISVVEPKDAKATPDAFELFCETPDGKFATPAWFDKSTGDQPTTTIGFNAAFLPLVVGVNRVRVTLNGEDIAHSPHNIQITEGKKICDRASHPNFEKDKILSDLPFSFIVQSADLCNNKKTVGGQGVFIAEISGGGLSSPITGNAVENGNGTVTINVPRAPKKAGNYQMMIGLKYLNQPAVDQFENERKATVSHIDAHPNGPWPTTAIAPLKKSPSKVVKTGSDGSVYLHVGDSPFSFDVLPGPDASKSTCSGDGMKSAIAGKPAYITLKTHDSNGKPVALGGLGDLLTFQCLSPDGHPATITPVKIVDNKNGEYSICYVPEKAGKNKVVLQIDGQNVAGSPFEVAVSPGDADANHTIATGEGIVACHVGKPAHFKIEYRDAYDNPCDVGTAVPTVEVVGGPGYNKPLATPPKVDNPSGNVEYLPDEIGPTKITVKLNGQPIKNSPYTVASSAGLPSHLTTEAKGDGLHNAVSGVPAEFVVTTRDVKGNLAPTPANVTFHLQTSTGKKINGTVTAKEPGHYHCTYTPDESGAATLHVLLDNQDIKNSPYHLTVGAGAADPTKTVVDPIEGTAVAGHPVSFKIHLNDKDGHAAAGGLAGAIWVGCEGPDGSAVANSSTIKELDNGGGYEATFFPEKAGPNKVSIKIKGVDIPALTVPVVPGAADASKTTAEGPGLHSANVGHPAQFKVLYKDKCGNPCTLGSAALSVDVVGPNGQPISQAPKVDAPAGDVSYTPDELGATTITVKLNGTPIQHSPFTVNTSAGSANASTTTAEGPGLIAAASGSEAHFTVTTKDVKGNRVPTPGANVGVVLISPSGKKTNGSITDNGDGSYACKYLPEESGASTIEVTLDGHAIKDAPFKVNVAAGSADAGKTTASGEGLNNAVAGEPATFKVTLKDKDGNQPTTGGSASAISVVCVGPDGKAASTPAEVKDNNDGTYDVTYVPEAAGNNHVTVKLNGTPIVGCPHNVAVVPGAADASKTTAEGEGLSRGYEGVAAHFVVKTFDRCGNPCQKGGESIVVPVKHAGSSDVLGKVVDNHNGTYAVEYTPIGAGVNNVHVHLHGKDIQQSPFHADIKSIAELMAENSALLAQIATVRQQRNDLIAIIDDDQGKNSVCNCGLPCQMDCSKCKTTFITKDWLQKKFPGWVLRTGFP